MKRHWQRGLLLGVSLALLLSGGVAIAASVRVTADQACFECVSRDEYPVPEDKIMELTYSGFDPGETLYTRLTIDGSFRPVGSLQPPLAGPQCRFRIYVPCDNLYIIGGTDCVPGPGGTVFPGEVDPSVALLAKYGEWTWGIEQNGDADEVSFLFAEDCAAAMFVPEPGSILLLGSGLAGLAGYGTLRLRSGQVLRGRNGD